LSKAADRFCHLHVHSHFSLLDGVNTIPNMVRLAKDQGMKALALTDHGNMFGAVEFHQTCRQEGIKPIIGMEAYITDGSRHDKKREAGRQPHFHLVLLAKNEAGYRNLCKLSSLAFIEGFYYKPRIDHEILKLHSEGLIATSACLAGEINRALLHGDSEKAEECARRYIDIFEPGHFFMEVQDHGLTEQRRIVERAPDLAHKMGVPIIATNDVHYLTNNHARAQEVHLCINTGKQIDDSDRMTFESKEFYFKTGKEMEQLFGDFPEYLTNTDEIAAMVDFELETDKMFLPVFFEGNEPPAFDEASAKKAEDENIGRFRELVEEGFARLYPDPPEGARERLEYEIGIITNMGFISYFLITWDFCHYARENDIPIGPGRGSAVGSIVSYCLGITNLCPLKYDLIFERFLNSDRISMPDIDIDFCVDGREKVIEYVRDKYGEDRVCKIATFGTMAAKAALKDVGRVLNIPLSEVNELTKKVPDVPGIKLKEAIESEPDLAKATRDPRYLELFEVAQKLEGLNRHCSTHAAGVVIADRPLTELIPLSRNGEDIVTQFPMEILEKIGLLKVDFLGLRYLTILDKATQLVEDSTGEKLDLENLPLDDKPTYDLLCQGETHGIFQLESGGMRELLRNLKPDCFEDIIAVLALYRPGPIGSGMHHLYCDRKHGREKMEYLHPSLEELLHDTNGVILYQEQVMRIANQMAGFSMNDADNLRKAMGKKKIELMEKFRDQFINGAKEKNQVPEKISKAIFEQIEQFAKYGFNKSHSTAYALISYQCAYLKANHPEAFLAAVMSCYISTVDTMVTYLEECKEMDIEVIPPHVNFSKSNFSLREDKVVYGLVAIKGVGEKVIAHILAERDRKGPFKSLYDLTTRVKPELINKKVLESLINGGAFDDLGQSRSTMTAAVGDALEEGKRIHAEREAGQLSLFGNGSEPEAEENWPQVPEWADGEMLSREKSALGFYLSGHPLERKEEELLPVRTHLIRELSEKHHKTQVTLAAMVSQIVPRQTRKGDPMAIVTIEDRSGSLEAIYFPKAYLEFREDLAVDEILVIQGTAEIIAEEEGIRGERKIIVNRAFSLSSAASKLAKQIGISFPSDVNEKMLFETRDIMQRFPGKIPVTLIFDHLDDHAWRVPCGNGQMVSGESGFIEEVRTLLGESAIRMEIAKPKERA